MKNVRIKSTGPNCAYPVVIDADTGEEIPNVRAIDIRIRPDEIVSAMVEVLPSSIDVIARAKIVEAGAAENARRALDVLRLWKSRAAVMPEVVSA
jgi:hypothetical protein